MPVLQTGKISAVNNQESQEQKLDKQGKLKGRSCDTQPSNGSFLKTSLLGFLLLSQGAIAAISKSPTPSVSLNTPQLNYRALAENAASFGEFAGSLEHLANPTPTPVPEFYYIPTWHEWVRGMDGAVKNGNIQLINHFYVKYPEYRLGSWDEYAETMVMTAVQAKRVPVLDRLIELGYPIDRRVCPGSPDDFSIPPWYRESNVKVSSLNIALEQYLYEGSSESLEMLKAVLKHRPKLNGNYLEYSQHGGRECMGNKKIPTALDIICEAQVSRTASIGSITDLFFKVLTEFSFRYHTTDARILETLDLILHQEGLDLSKSDVMCKAIDTARGELGIEIIRRLLAAGAEVNGRSANFGETPLFLAVQKGDEMIVQLLLDHGAKVPSCALEEPKHNPLALAEFKKEQNILSKLKNPLALAKQFLG